MPRRPRSQAPEPASQPAIALPANAVLIVAPDSAPTGSVLKNLLSKHRTAQEAMNEIKDSLGGLMTDATQNRSLNKKAWNMLKSLDKMAPGTIADTVQAFLYYYEASGMKRRADSAPRLPMGGDGPVAAETDTDTDTIERVGRGSVTPFPRQEAAAAG